MAVKYINATVKEFKYENSVQQHSNTACYFLGPNYHKKNCDSQLPLSSQKTIHSSKQ